MRKKIICFALLCFIMMEPVSAKEEVYYGPYQTYSNWQREKVDSSDVVAVQKERRYRYFYDEKQYGAYEILNTPSIDYPYYDINDYKKGKVSDWNEEAPEMVEKRKIEKQELYQFQVPKKVRYLYLHDFKGPREQFLFPELEILIGNEKIKYGVTCTACSEQFGEKIQNGNHQEPDVWVNLGTTIVIDLYQLYDIKDIRLKFSILDTSRDIKEWKYDFTDQLSTIPNYFTNTGFGTTFHGSTITDPIVREFTVHDYNFLDRIWGEKQYSILAIKEEKTVKVHRGTFYRYQDTFYHQYQIQHYETDDYTPEGVGKYQTKIEDAYQDWYRFKNRDQVILSGNWIIKDRKFELKDWILKKSRDVSIQSNIELTKNGTYEVVFDMGFTKVKKKVIVDILENIVNEYQEVIALENQVKKEIESLEKRDPEEKNPEVQTKIATLKDEAQQLKKRKEFLARQINSKPMPLSKSSMISIPYILFLFLLLLLLWLGQKFYRNLKR